MFQIKQQYERKSKSVVKKVLVWTWIVDVQEGRREVKRTSQMLGNFYICNRPKKSIEISQVPFQKICEVDIKWHPYKIFKRHELFPTDLPRKLQFRHWLLNQGERHLDNFVIWDDAAFCLNGGVNTQNVREYSPMRHPSSFNYETNMCGEKWSVWAGMCGNGVLIKPHLFRRKS